MRKTQMTNKELIKGFMYAAFKTANYPTNKAVSVDLEMHLKEIAKRLDFDANEILDE